MKLRLAPVAIAAVACAWLSAGPARADDVKLTNGSALHDVTISSGDDSGVSITSYGFLAVATKYPWAAIHPDDRPRLRKIVADLTARQERRKAVEDSAIFAALEVMKIEDNGILVRFAKAVPLLTSSDPDHPEYTHEPWDEAPIFIFLADTSGLSAGKKGLQKLYPVGTFKESGNSYRAFVTRADDAEAMTEPKK
jgi:hypothetical protein